MQKNVIYENVEIIDNGMEFEGIAKIDGLTVFIPYGIKGEVVNIKIIKVNKNFAIGKITEIVIKSKYREDSICEVFGKCGGCSALNIEYNYTLNVKKQMLLNLLNKQKVKYPYVENVIGMGMPYYYRNKCIYPVRQDKNDKTVMGFYSKLSHRIVENDCCYIQNRVIDMIAKETFEILINLGFTGYNEEDLTGDIRNIVVKRGLFTGEILITIVLNNSTLFNDVRFNEYINKINLVSENIKSVVLNLNTSNTNEILGKEQKVLYGNGYITDYIGKYKYYISSKSFFQVNTLQAEMLYDILKEKLNLTGDEILFDLYSGVGTIGIYLSESVSKIYGIEIEETAVKMANMNIKENNICNAEYTVGSVEDKIVEFSNRNIKPDVIVVDPPRKGLDQKSIEYIKEFKPKKIGYVSCNPATLARDLKYFEEDYDIVSLTPVDMFPFTAHVETVVLMSRKK